MIMILYHIISQEEELDTTTSLRTAKDRARSLGAYAVLAVDHKYTSNGCSSELVATYIYSPNIGIYNTYNLDYLRKLAEKGFHLLPQRFLDSFR